ALAELEQHAKDLLDNASRWPDLSDATAKGFETSVARHYENVLTLAQAFTAARSRYHASPEVRTRIETELRNGLKVTRPGTPRPGNWYPWVIGAPRAIGPTLLLLHGKIDSTLADDSVKAMADLVKEPALSGANAVWEGRNQLYLGLLQKNPARVSRAVEFLQREVSVGPGATGLLEDYSFQFHGRLLHTSGYGGGYASSAAEVAWLCDGTAWAMPQARRDLLANHLLEHARW